MKKLLSTLMAATFLAAAQSGATLLWENDFSDTNLFPTGETVAGKNGWVVVLNDSGNDTDGSVISHEGQNVGQFLSTSTDEFWGYRRLTMRTTFTPITEPQMRIKLGVGWSWTSQISGQTAAIHFGNQDYWIPLSIVFDGSQGILLHGEGDTLLLETAKVKQGYLYQFEVVLNYQNKTFNLLMTGEDAEGQAVSIPVAEQAFRWTMDSSDLNFLRGFFVTNYRGDAQTLYLDKIEVSAIPEAGATVQLVLGGLLLGGGLLWRRKAGARA